MSPKKQLLISLGLLAVGVGMIVMENLANRKIDAKNKKAFEESMVEHEKFTKNIEALTDELDRRIVNGKFWMMVIEENER